ncbi:MAG: hypothetical protein K0B15_07240 [Lentimicrobium sp.]|nr:hypothetical protein [Lentimicrobium sp.]
MDLYSTDYQYIKNLKNDLAESPYPHTEFFNPRSAGFLLRVIMEREHNRNVKNHTGWNLTLRPSGALKNLLFIICCQRFAPLGL